MGHLYLIITILFGYQAIHNYFTSIISYVSQIKNLHCKLGSEMHIFYCNCLLPYKLIYSTGQARLDGFFCDYSKEDKMAFLRRVHNRGIKNIEMESLCFAAYCYRAGIKSKHNSLHSPIGKLNLFQFFFIVDFVLGTILNQHS